MLKTQKILKSLKPKTMIIHNVTSAFIPTTTFKAIFFLPIKRNMDKTNILIAFVNDNVYHPYGRKVVKKNHIY